MKALFHVAFKSLWNRKATTILTIFSIMLSTTLLIGIERIRSGTRESFASTVSGVDLIVGARSGPINLLLYSVFRIGNATNNISMQSYKEITEHPDVEWAFPISLGDSHRGFRVVGTTKQYFSHFQYAGGKSIELSEGREFEKLFDVVIGSDVARDLQYSLGTSITLSHGMGEVQFQDHADKPFQVVGILQRTGTPIDKSVHVSLEAITALHIDWQDGAPPMPGEEIDKQKLATIDLTPSAITAAFVRLKSRIAVLRVQRLINEYDQEALSAIMPGASLMELWDTIGMAESALFFVSLLVFFVSLVGMIIALIATLNERRREMAILRSIGAKRGFIFSLLIVETGVLSITGVVFGLIALYASLFSTQSLLESQLGLTVGLFSPTVNEVYFLTAMIFGSLLAGFMPAWRAYRNSLADGLIVHS